MVLELSVRTSASPWREQSDLVSSDHVVLKSSIRISASPWQQRFNWGVMVTQDAYFSLLTHTKNFFGTEVSFGQTEPRMNTDVEV